MTKETPKQLGSWAGAYLCACLLMNESHIS